jgi:hypothetical protein
MAGIGALQIADSAPHSENADEYGCRRLGHGNTTTVARQEAIDFSEVEHRERGRFAKGNRFAARERRKPAKVAPLVRVRRVVHDIIGKLRRGKMPPAIANALVLACRLELELIERIETSSSVEAMQNEIYRLTEQVRDLVAAAATGSAH